MIALQVFWLTAIWLTGASTNLNKLLTIGIYTMASGAAVGLMPKTFLTKISRVRGILAQNEKLFVLSLSVVVLLVGVAYATFQRVWFYDEINSFEASKIVAVDGLATFFRDYSEIDWLGKQHPPLVPLTYGLAMRIFGTDLLVIRLVSLVFGIGTFLVTFLLGRELYDQSTGLLAAVLLLSFPLIFRLGTTAMTDMQVTFLFSLALLLTLHLARAPTFRLSIALGVTLGVGLLSKYTMVFIYPLLFSLFLISSRFRRLKVHLGIAALISGTMLAMWLLYASEIGVLAGQRETLDIEPGWFVRNSWGLKLTVNSLLTRLPSAFGVYNIPIILLGGYVIIRRRQQSDVFIFLWVAIMSLLLVVTLPDHRYFMPTFPALAILMALWLRYIPEAVDRVVVLALLCCGGALYLFVDWFREAQLFTP